MSQWNISVARGGGVNIIFFVREEKYGFFERFSVIQIVTVWRFFKKKITHLLSVLFRSCSLPLFLSVSLCIAFTALYLYFSLLDLPIYIIGFLILLNAKSQHAAASCFRPAFLS